MIFLNQAFSNLNWKLPLTLQMSKQNICLTVILWKQAGFWAELGKEFSMILDQNTHGENDVRFS